MLFVSGWIAAGVCAAISFYLAFRLCRKADSRRPVPSRPICTHDGIRYSSIFDNLPIGYFRSGIDGSSYEINPALVKILGYDSFDDLLSAAGGPVLAIYSEPSERQRMIDELMDKGVPGIFTVRFLKKDGTVIPCEIHAGLIRDDGGEPMYIEGLIEDISDRMHMREIMIRTERMATVAGLAAGMAHEINNPLGIMMQMAENAQRRLLSDLPANREACEKAGISYDALTAFLRERKIDRYLTAIREAGERAANIVSWLFRFSRQSDSAKTITDINALVGTAVDLAEQDYDLKKRFEFRNIAISRSLGDVPRVLCVESQIQQVILNIIRSAAQALLGCAEPKMDISTVFAEGEVRIRIADNGPGMDEAVRMRVFEPFFTTRPEDGTGLGLTVVYYIVVNGHSGRVEVETEKGKGSALTVALPPGG